MSLKTLTTSLKALPAWNRKREIEVLADSLGRHPPLVGNQPVLVGDDAAAIKFEDGYLLLAAEVIYPPVVKSDPYLAGRYGILANINDIYAMGGYPQAVVDTILAENVSHASEILRGLQDGCERYGIALVGGHLTAAGDTNSLTVSILGTAKKLLTSFNAQPGDVILYIINLEGKFHEQYPFWNCSGHLSGTELRRDLAILPKIAEAGWCDSARDISMTGILGSLLMLLECSGVGAVIDLDKLPVPVTVQDRFLDWLISFPSYGFVLTARSEFVTPIQELFSAHDIACVNIGHVLAGHEVTLTKNQEESLLHDFSRESFIGFSRSEV